MSFRGGVLALAGSMGGVRGSTLFRKGQQVASHQSSFSVLHDLPDWSFADGRPAPVTEKQRQWIRSRVREELEHKALQQRVQNGETDTVL